MVTAPVLLLARLLHPHRQAQLHLLVQQQVLLRLQVQRQVLLHLRPVPLQRLLLLLHLRRARLLPMLKKLW
jgi:hypothetical protein